MDPELHEFVCQINQQLEILQGGEYEYWALHVYVKGVPEPWQIEPGDECVLNEDSGLLIYRANPDEWDNADVPENVIRLKAIVATQLV